MNCQLNYLVSVVRQKRQGCGNAPLSCQQTGILTHLLSQESSYCIHVHGLGELHSFSEDDNFLNQILNDKNEGQEDNQRSQTHVCKRQQRNRIIKIYKPTKVQRRSSSLLEKCGRAKCHLGDGQWGGEGGKGGRRRGGSLPPMDIVYWGGRGGGWSLLLIEDAWILSLPDICPLISHRQISKLRVMGSYPVSKEELCANAACHGYCNNTLPHRLMTQAHGLHRGSLKGWHHWGVVEPLRSGALGQ